MITEEARKKMGWKRGKIFTAYEKECEICGKKFRTIPSSSQQYCCSRECSWARKRLHRVKGTCVYCGKEIETIQSRASKRKYCSTECKISALAEHRIKEFKTKRIWKEWKDYRTAKKWFLDEYGKCMRCGYSERVDILELHHIDRNRKNNSKENLALICPNCHTIDHLDAGDGQFKANKGVLYAINREGKEAQERI